MAAQQAALGSYGVRSLAYVTSAFSVLSTISIPGTAQIGDLAILTDMAVDTGGGGVSDVTPAGFTGIATGSNTNARTRASFKIIASGDPGAGLTGLTGADGIAKAIAIFRPDGIIREVSFGSYSSSRTSGDPVASNVAAASITGPLLVHAMATNLDGSTAFNAATLPAFDATVLSGDGKIRIGYKHYPLTGVDHVVDKDDQGVFGTMQAFWLSVL